MASFCPFVGGDCVEEKCKMWRDGDCLIPPFLSTSIVRNIQELSSEEDFESDFEEEDFEDDGEEDEDEK